MVSLTWHLLLVATATGRKGFGLKAGTLSQFTAPAMRKEMHWPLTAGALLALVLHHPRLPQPVVEEALPGAQEVLHGLLLPGLIERAERSE